MRIRDCWALVGLLFATESVVSEMEESTVDPEDLVAAAMLAAAAREGEEDTTMRLSFSDAEGTVEM